MPKPAQWQRLYPFKSQRLNLEGLRYHYLDEGTGEPVLMVHGNPTWSFYWRNLVTALRGSYRTVVPDHIGCGLSDKPADYPYSLRQHTANLARLIDQLRLENITLVGHDWGGAIGLGAALARPDQFARIVLLNTGAFPPPRVPRRIAVCRTPVLGRVAVQGLNLFTIAALRLATCRPERLTAAVREGMLAPYDCWSHRVGIYQFVRDIPLTRRHPTHAVLQQLERQLPALRALPVQLIWGMRDWCFTAVCLQRLEQLFPAAEVHRIKDAGHWVVEDASEQVVSLIRDFLQRHSHRAPGEPHASS